MLRPVGANIQHTQRRQRMRSGRSLRLQRHLLPVCERQCIQNEEASLRELKVANSMKLQRIQSRRQTHGDGIAF